jgi:peptidoglycan/LPS O-acetylase OafA/YrhL
MIARHYSSTNFITGLRAIAIFMVFLIHSGGGGLREFSEVGDRVVSLGKYGVEIFFVISGFTIFYQFFKRDYSLKNFLKVRLFRIAIPYFPILLILFLFSNFFMRDISFLDLLSHLFFLNFLSNEYANSIIGVEWTLSVEVFYYLLFGILITYGLMATKFKNLISWFILLFSIAIITAYLVKSNTINTLTGQFMPFKYGYMFVLGGVAFILREYFEKNYSEEFLNKFSNITLFLSVFLFFSYLTITMIPSSATLNEIFFSVLTFILIIFIRDGAIFSKIFTNNIILFFGSISYSFYLLHFVVIKTLPLEEYSFIVWVTLTTLVSLAWYLFFEKFIYQKVKRTI